MAAAWSHPDAFAPRDPSPGAMDLQGRAKDFVRFVIAPWIQPLARATGCIRGADPV
jgi:hypothetical protein